MATLTPNQPSVTVRVPIPQPVARRPSAQAPAPAPRPVPQQPPAEPEFARRPFVAPSSLIFPHRFAAPRRMRRPGRPRRYSAGKAEFHRAIVAEPENHLHSLVYADQLEEEGKPAHAAFIRKAVEQAGTGWAAYEGRWDPSYGGEWSFDHHPETQRLQLAQQSHDDRGREIRWLMNTTGLADKAGWAQRLYDEGAYPFGSVSALISRHRRLARSEKIGHLIRKHLAAGKSRKAAVLAAVRELRAGRKKKLARGGRPVRYSFARFDDVIRTIREHPDRAPIMADWLEERGLHADDHTLTHMRSGRPVYAEKRGGKVWANPMTEWAALGPMQRSYIDAGLEDLEHDPDQVARTGRRLRGSVEGIDGVDPWTLNEMAHDVNRFWRTLPDDLREVVADHPTMAGYHLWLTRNGHGHGFWGEPELWRQRGDDLTEHVHRHFGEYDLYRGDDGRIYGQGYHREHPPESPPR